MAATATCMLCGKEYEVCKNCPETKLYTPWRKRFDTAQHFQIYGIFRELRDGVITSAEAKAQFDNLNVKIADIKQLLPDVQAILLPVFETKVQEPVVKKQEFKKQEKKFEKPEQKVQAVE